MKKAAQHADDILVKNDSPVRVLISVASISGKLYYFQKEPARISIHEETTGGKISKTEKNFIINNLNEKSESVNKLSYLSISKLSDGFAGIIGFDNNYYAAISKDGFMWDLKDTLPKKVTSAYIAPSYEFQGENTIYWSDDAIHVGFSKNLSSWTLYDDPIYTPYSKNYQSINILGLFTGKDSLFVPFATCTDISGTNHFSLSVAIFSKSDPKKISWRIQYPIWNVPRELIDQIVAPVGVVTVNNKIYSFWQGRNQIFSFRHPLLEHIIFEQPEIISASVKKVDHNPILSPGANNSWESLAVFNPAAIYDEDEKKLHLMYRAVGNDWRSVFGYATSSDGTHIDSKKDFPVYVPRASFEGQYGNFDPNSPFASGPGAGGCEDPRLTRIDDTIYLTYVVFDGWSGPRVALSSISNEDFVNNKWNWSNPVIISKPGVVDKNAVIFPEKIKGKYVIMHRIFPDILIDFVDNIDFDGQTFLKGEYKIEPRNFGWDSRKIGAGPPPIKTKDGWLLIYHAVDDKQSHKYQIGAMLLDLLDPTKVLCRSSQPIMSPTHWYENEGYKSGVVYPCGAAVINNILHIYYGGADTYVCAATAPFNEFLEQLVAEKNQKMKVSFVN